MKQVEVYTADCGNLKLTNGTVSVSFANRIGDGVYYVTIIDDPKEEYDTRNYAWEGMVEGSWDIEAYDCGAGNPIAHIEGRYAIYSNKGDMLVKKI